LEPFYVALALLALLFVFNLIGAALKNFTISDLEELAHRKRKSDRIQAFLPQAHCVRVGFQLLTPLVATAFALAVFISSLQVAGSTWWSVLSAGLVAYLLLVTIGWAVPRSFGTHLAERITLAFAPVGTRLAPVFKYVEVLGNRLDRWVARVCLDETAESNHPTVEQEEIRQRIEEGIKEGSIENETVEMIARVVEFKDRDVAEVMTPRTDMVAVDVALSVHEAMQIAVNKGYSRIPVIEKTHDNVVGILYVKDLLQSLAEQGTLETSLSEVMREPLFVPETKPVLELLKELRDRKVQMALVLDEYGGTAGLVTIEDIVEELVGEIEDEYDVATGLALVQVNDSTVEVIAGVRIDEVNEALDVHLQESEDFDTVGGLVFSTLGRIPGTGAVLTIGDASFEVLDADKRRIRRLRIRKLEEDDRRP